MIPKEYRDAHNDLDCILSDMKGLLNALYKITTDSEAISLLISTQK